MDHLPRPSHPIRSRSDDQVPLVCSEHEPYDNGDFLTYPSRIGWIDPIKGKGGWQYFMASKDLDLKDDKEMRRHEMLFQSWIFFGLLHKMLAPMDLYDAHDYIDEDKMVHTRLLESRLLSWRSSFIGLSEEEKARFTEDMKQCIIVAQETLLALNNDNYQRFSIKLKHSLAAICQTVEEVLVVGDSIWNIPRYIPSLDAESRQRMLNHGWCPSEITAMSVRHAYDTSSFRYAQNLSRPTLGMSHTSCDEENCAHLQIVPGTYKPRHAVAHCTCTSIGPSLSDVEACLTEDSYPVLEVTGESIDDVAVRIRHQDQLGDDYDYVAFSHVCADGLGNPHSMTLPRCQLLRLKDLVESISTLSIDRGNGRLKAGRRLLLWCDTLCCPIGKGKAGALRKMRAVYENTACVLVLDRELEQFNYSELDDLEAMTRLLLSRWMKRMWTYQEGGLAQKLLVQFKDTAVDSLALIKSCHSAAHVGVLHRRQHAHAFHFMNTLRSRTVQIDSPVAIRNAALGLQGRKVSYASDEPLCLATVLGLDSGKIAEMDTTDLRMKQLWRLVSQSQHGVSESVIFNRQPRLQLEGFRWAPRTFQQHARATFDTINIEGDLESGVLTARGLRIQRAGWRIEPARFPSKAMRELWSGTKNHPNLTMARLGNTCYNIIYLLDQHIASSDQILFDMIQDEKKKWFVILQKAAQWDWIHWQTQQKGLLVNEEKHESGLVYHRSRMVVMVDRVQPTIEIPRLADYFYASRVLQSWTMTVVNTLHYTAGVMDNMIAWLPSDFNKATATLVGRYFGYLYGPAVKRLKVMMISAKTEAPKLPEVAELLRNMHKHKEYAAIGGQIVQAYTSEYVNVIETLDASTEWYVD